LDTTAVTNYTLYKTNNSDKLKSVMSKKIKNAIDTINPDAVYEPTDVPNLHPFFSERLKNHTVYRLIRDGKIEATDFGIGDVPRYEINGYDLIEAIKSIYSQKHHVKAK